jgi:lipid II:glycine glycyltransferase (peptidoglycan interpeptide bridge formation enzyme)
VKGEVASAYLLMHDFSTAYYHFGGSDDRFYNLRPNNLLLFETALWAKRIGFRHYHLGGGVSSTADDSLLRYKAGFSDRRAKLYTYGRVHSRSVYDRLCELKISHERSVGQINDSDYFPLYRR